MPGPIPERLIAHLDMDAFYASVELLRYPELRGVPLVVGGGQRHHPAESVDPATGQRVREFAKLRGYEGRGVATTASYEARKLGVHSAMALMKAAKLAPDAVLLPTDFDAYRLYSGRFKAAVRAIAPDIEDRGIDEIYIDLTGVSIDSEARDGDPWTRACAVGSAIKQAVRDATGLSCSIGIAANKLLAKIASDLDKPDALTVLTADDVPRRVWPLPTRKINGIGPKSAAKLEGLDIHTVGDLAAADPALLVANFGANYGAWLHEAAHGRDERPIVTYSEPKSLSRETTFERDLHAQADREALSRIFTELCREVSEDLKRKGYAGRTIGLKLRFANFKTLTRDQTLPEPTQDAQVIRRAAGECLKRVPLERRIRLLGVRVGSLSPADTMGPHVPAVQEPSPAEALRSLFD